MQGCRRKGGFQPAGAGTTAAAPAGGGGRSGYPPGHGKVFWPAGYHARFAANARGALATAAGERFDVLLSDLRLPDGDGWELLRRLKEAGHCPPRAIAMSAWGSEAAQAKSRAAGFEAHLVKPFTAQELQAALQEATTPAN